MILTPDTLPDWERVMDEFAQQEPHLVFRGLVAHQTSEDDWEGLSSYQWPNEDPWLGINADLTRRRKEVER